MCTEQLSARDFVFIVYLGEYQLSEQLNLLYRVQNYREAIEGVR